MFHLMQYNSFKTDKFRSTFVSIFFFLIIIRLIHQWNFVLIKWLFIFNIVSNEIFIIQLLNELCAWQNKDNYKDTVSIETRCKMKNFPNINWWICTPMYLTANHRISVIMVTVSNVKYHPKIKYFDKLFCNLFGTRYNDKRHTRWKFHEIISYWTLVIKPDKKATENNLHFRILLFMCHGWHCR